MIGLLAVLACSVWAVLAFVAHEQRRDLLLWQDRLGLAADSRFTAIDRWLGQQFQALFRLATNGSLQLYTRLSKSALSR